MVHTKAYIDDDEYFCERLLFSHSKKKQLKKMVMFVMRLSEKFYIYRQRERHENTFYNACKEDSTYVNN